MIVGEDGRRSCVAFVLQAVIQAFEEVVVVAATTISHKVQMIDDSYLC